MSDDRRMRISDADRDEAVEALSEHYASGRLTKDEYDERVDHAWAARFQGDLDPLFSDLPRRDQPRVATWSSPPIPEPPPWSQAARQRPGRARRYPVPPILFALPVLAVGAIATVVILQAPWLLFVVFCFFACGGFGRRHAHGAHRW